MRDLRCSRDRCGEGVSRVQDEMRLLGLLRLEEAHKSMACLTDDDGVWKSAPSFKIRTRRYEVPEMVIDNRHFSSVGTR